MAGGLAGCAPGKSSEDGALSETGAEGNAHVVASDTAILEGQGEWITVCCPYNCGGYRCVNKAYVVDGVVVRQKSADDSEDTEEAPQMRACARGRTQRQAVLNADRIKYPMKRKNWQPGGGDNVNGQLRGVDEWERISWDEALDMIASEMQRIYDTYGPRSVLVPAPFTPTILNLMGGAVCVDETKSYGTWQLGAFDLGYKISPAGNAAVETGNDRADLQNADTIVLYGVDTAWVSGGNPAYYYRLAREKGVEFVYVGPNYPQTASMVDARWIQVRPGTDTAFLMAVIYEMLRLDEEGGDIIDWDFVHKYTVGIDEESMPAAATVNENLKDYVLGKYDGVPKTPEWATEMCGTPVEDITWYAETVGKQHNVIISYNYAPARYNGAEYFPQLMLAHGFMGGHAGRPGNATGSSYAEEAANGGTKLIQYGMASAFGAGAPNPLEGFRICGPEVWQCVREKKYTFRGYCGMSNAMSGGNQFVPQQEYDFDVKMIYGVSGNQTWALSGLTDAIEAYRSVDFVVTSSYSYSITAQLSDIVLPQTTSWEGNLYPAKGEQSLASNFPGLTVYCYGRDHAIFPSPAIMPIYEAKDSSWVDCELMKRLKLDWEAQYPISAVQGWYDTIAGSMCPVKDPTDLQPLVTITQEDIDEWGVVGTPQQGMIGLKELLEKGVYQIPRTAGDSMGFIGYQDFIADPEANPLPSQSGKIEIYCQQRADKLNSVGYAKSPLSPYPVYVDTARQSYKDSFSDWENKVKGEYPFQMYQPHYPRRAHTMFDNSVMTQEAFVNPVFLNAEDAAEKGIQNGDTVRVWNYAGQVLRQASVTNTMMRGVVALPHGPRADIDFETGIDRGGNEESLTGRLQQGEWFPQLNGYNSNLVNYEKWDGEPIPRDCDREPFTIVKE